MADIEKLTDSTERIKAKADKSVGWPLAAIKAIEGSGIRHKPDVARLKKEVLSRLKERGAMQPKKAD